MEGRGRIWARGLGVIGSGGRGIYERHGIYGVGPSVGAARGVTNHETQRAGTV